MRRPAIVGVTLGAVLAFVPLVSRAAPAPSVTLLSPSANHVTNGDLSVRWSYAGFYKTTPIDIEAAVGGGPFQRVARTVVDDGTPGYFGSYTMSTTSLADGADYAIRVIMPTSKQVTSSVSPITIDNTGPTSTVTAEPVAEGGPVVSIAADVEGTSVDALSTVASVSVTFTASSGTDTVQEATCDCGTPSADWSASTDGLLPGQYTVTAVAVDALGNVGAAASADMIVVGTPADPTPALVETVNGVIATVTGTTVVEDAVETVTGTTTVGVVVETVTGLGDNPPTANETIATVTGTLATVTGTVLGLTVDTGGGS